MCKTNRAHRPIAGKSTVANYAFHLDATEFANYLKETSVRRGVKHVEADVERVDRLPNGHIQQLHTSGAQCLSADLYIDCTGFTGVLIEKEMQDPFIDWSDYLLCDRAVVCRQPYRNQNEFIPPYTVSKGLNAGWSWSIPLHNRKGHGYVYSSRHTSDETAADELLQDAGCGDKTGTDLRHLKMRVGRRANFWKHNCVSLGLSSGFIEPLESTGIFLIQRALEVLVEWFPSKSYSAPLIKAYNQRMGGVFAEVRDFIILHYLLSQRNDQPFWIDSRNVPVPDSLQDLLDFYRETGMIKEVTQDPVFQKTNFYHVLVGGNNLPRQSRSRAEFSNFPAVCQLLENIRSNNASLVKKLPHHDALMQWLHQRESVSDTGAKVESHLHSAAF